MTQKQFTRFVRLKRLHICELKNLSIDLLLGSLSGVIGTLQIVQSSGVMLAVFASMLGH